LKKRSEKAEKARPKRGNDENGEKQGRGQAAAQAKKTQPSPASTRNVYLLASHVQICGKFKTTGAKDVAEGGENACGKFRKMCKHRQILPKAILSSREELLAKPLLSTEAAVISTEATDCLRKGHLAHPGICKNMHMLKNDTCK